MDENLQGYTQLRERLAALQGDRLTRPLVHMLGAAALREQKLALYEKVERRTGGAGQQVQLGTVTDTSVETVARGVALIVDQGSKPHDIYPVRKKALFFSATGAGTRLTGSVSSIFRGAKGLARSRNAIIGRDASGGVVRADIGLTFAKHVRHPGTKPHPFMVEGAERAIQKAGLAERIVAAWNRRGIA